MCDVVNHHELRCGRKFGEVHAEDMRTTHTKKIRKTRWFIWVNMGSIQFVETSQNCDTKFGWGGFT